MIISHKHKFIFLHVPKVAGSTIKVFFSRYLGENDILNGWNDVLRNGVHYNKKTLQLVNNKFGLEMISKAINLRIKDNKIFERPIIDYALREVLKKKIGTNSVHATAEHIKKFNPKIWQKYFKFAFVRNPYTHAISCWLWDEKNWSIINKKVYKKRLSKLSFLKYLKTLKKKIKKKGDYYHDKIPGNKIYSINNKIAVNFIGKFESLEKDLFKIKKILKLPNNDFKLIHAKKNSSNSNLKFYSKESKLLVEQIWKKELELFNYKFPKNF